MAVKVILQVYQCAAVKVILQVYQCSSIGSITSLSVCGSKVTTKSLSVFGSIGNITSLSVSGSTSAFKIVCQTAWFWPNLPCKSAQMIVISRLILHPMILVGLEASDK